MLNTAFDRKDKKVFKGGEVMDKSCNLDKFFDGCLRLGIEKVFSVEDLESGTSEGADAVAQTVLKLKTLADSKNASTPLRGGVFKTPSGEGDPTPPFSAPASCRAQQTFCTPGWD